MQSFPFVGGHIAVDFVNTRPMRGSSPHELLIDMDALTDWLSQAGVMLPDLTFSKAPAVYSEAIALREAIRACFVALGSADLPAGSDIAVLNRAMSALPQRRFLQRNDDRLELTEGKPTTISQLIGTIALAAAELIAGPAAGQLKQCRGQHCVLWFLDQSRNRSRHWCSMDRCGARAKSAAFYRRRSGKEKGLEQSPSPS